MFGTRRVLEEIRDIRGEIRDLRADWAEESIRTHAALAHTIEGESNLTRAAIESESKLTRAAIENNTRVTREILLELRDHRSILEHIDRGVQSHVDGLLRVLDELRGPAGGEGAAPAA